MPDETLSAESRKAWYDDRGMALWYLWGRIDMGEEREGNNQWEFARQWAEAKQAYREGKRGSIMPLQEALKKYDAGEAI